MKAFENFTNKFHRDITLRMKLQPVTITNSKIVDLEESPYSVKRKNDELIRQNYNSVKPAVDAYHKYLIDNGLKEILHLPTTDANGELTEKGRFVANIIAFDTNTDTEEMLDFVSDMLQTSKAPYLTTDFDFTKITKEEFISSELVSFLKNSKVSAEYVSEAERVKALEILETKNNKMYVSSKGLLSARTLMYGTKGKSVSVPYRSIITNLPKFIKDVAVFQKVQDRGILDVDQMNKDFAEELRTIELLIEAETSISITDVFCREMYPCFMVSDGIKALNRIIGTKQSKKSGVEGLNQQINKYNQIQDKKNAIAKMDELFDQILFGEDDYIAQLTDIADVKETIQDMVENVKSLYGFNGKDANNEIYNLLCSLPDYDINRIYVASSKLSSISMSLWKNYSILHEAVKRDKNGKTLQKQVSIKQIQSHIDSLNLEENHCVSDYFRKCQVEDVRREQLSVNLFEMLKKCYEEYCNSNILSLEVLTDKEVKVVQNMLDSIIALRRFMRTLFPPQDSADIDGAFYARFFQCWEKLESLDSKYDLVRNFFCRKPFQIEKTKLYFGVNDEHYLAGWPEQAKKGTTGRAYIFREKHSFDDEFDYYIGVSQNNTLFSGYDPETDSVCNFSLVRERLAGVSDLSMMERFYYYQMKSNTFCGQNYFNANKQQFKEAEKTFCEFLVSYSLTGNTELKKAMETAIAKKNDAIKKGKAIPDTLTIPDNIIKLIKKNDSVLYEALLDDNQYKAFNTAMLKRWKNAFAQAKRISYAQECALKDYQTYEEVKKDIAEVCSIKVKEFIPVSQHELEDALCDKNKPLYLFRITNKDLSYSKTMLDGKRKHRGTENLHTMYFRALMDSNQDVFDIGAGMIAYRPKTDEKKLKSSPTHNAGDKIKCKNPYNKGKLCQFSYDLVKDRHYTVDTYLFHLSVTQNYRERPTVDRNSLNQDVRDFIRENDVNVIGIDRGERNLLYYSLIDAKGNIIEQDTLNSIVYNGVSANGAAYKVETDYHELLETRADEIHSQQKGWKAVDKIKDVKAGYLSLVIPKLAKMMIEKKAIIVLEDLSGGFMGSRQSQMANVYQQFEEKLAQKLQFYVDKSLDANERTPGSLYNALQLAKEKNENEKQNGFIFYVPAWNTSKIDPLTGFVNLFKIRYENKTKARLFFETFKSISKNVDTGDYDFVFDYSDFVPMNMARVYDGMQTVWKVSTHGGRIERYRNSLNKWDCKPIESLTKVYDELFAQYDFKLESDIKDQIVDCNDAVLYQELIRLFKLTLQMRNSCGNKDYIVSPIKHNGVYYDSNRNDYSCVMPMDADANGAYNIARKGLMVVNRIKSNSSDLYIHNDEWLREAQKKMLSND